MCVCVFFYLHRVILFHKHLFLEHIVLALVSNCESASSGSTGETVTTQGKSQKLTFKVSPGSLSGVFCFTRTP